MKNKAFTLAETLIAITIMGILIMTGLRIIKPKEPNYGIFFTKGWDNLMKANEELIYRNEKGEFAQNSSSEESLNEESEEEQEEETKGLPDDYISALKDLMSTKETGCNYDICFQNGLSFDGLTFDGEGIAQMTMRIKGDDETHEFKIYKKDGMVVPQGDDLDSTETFKFRVVTKEGEILQASKSGISFKDAICLAKGQGDNNPYNVGCSSNSNDYECPYQASCDIEIFMPQGM